MTHPGPKKAKRAAAKTPPRSLAPTGVLAAAAAVGAVGAGVAIVEAAAVVLVVGGAAVLAPRLWRELRRRWKPPVVPVAAPAPSSDAVTRFISLPGLMIKQALAKTITYRVIITACDLGWNYAILADATAAAGLSAISLAAGPFSYFLHETGWNRFGPAGKNGLVTVPLPALGWPSNGPRRKKSTLAMDRSIAKTVTFRTIGTVMEFTTNYVVVRDVSTVAVLSAFGFVLGPFIYLGHEKVWELADAPRSEAPASSFLPAKAMPAPRRVAPVSA
jgi:uncharacterized membrane protein